jgi:hypothetical protein
MKRLCFTLLALSFLELFPLATLAINIDDFSPSSSQSLNITASGGTTPIEIDSLTAIGLHRVIVVSSVTGANLVDSLNVSVRPSFASPPHFSISQGSGVKGTTTIIWDKTTFTGAVNPAGLGGYNLTADGSTKFILSNFTFDFAGGNPCTLEMIIYDASSPTGQKASMGQLIIGGARSGSTEEINFGAFTSLAPGATSLADLTNVGAIVLHIKPEASADISFDVLGTDGTCTGTPTKTYVVDQCAVCNGNNTSCADCAGTPNGSALPGTSCTTGTPGVCSSGKFQPDCSCASVTTSSVEICDGLDNDCNGLADENSICSQPLTKTNPCVKDVKGDYYAKVRKDFAIQYQTIHDAAYKVVGKPSLRDRALAIIRLNALLRTSSKKIISRLPSQEIFANSECINISCASKTYAKELSTLATNSSKWYKLAQQVIGLMKESRAGGACEGDATYCAIRLKLRIQEYNRILASMKKYAATHKALSKKGPITVKSCSLI